MQIYIGVENKVAQLVDLKQYIVCGNSDYIINFLFDDEWNDHVAKTARFEWGSNSVEVPFTGNQCPCPVITDTIVVKIGVFAGDLDATTPAYVMCRKSILCGSGGHDDPSLDVYNQLMGLLDEMQTGGGSGKPGKDGITPHIGENGNWYIGDEDTGVQAQGEDGEPGQPGEPGSDYVLTESDKAEIAQEAARQIDTSGFAKQTEVDNLSKAKVNLPTNEDGTPNHGTVGYYAVSDGAGGITWVASGNTGGGTDEPVTPNSHGIVWDLVNVTSSNPITSVSDGASLVAVLTAADGYTLGDVTVTMGGEVLTGVWNADTSTITIASVTGDVIISCAGIESVEPETIDVPFIGWAQTNYNNTATVSGILSGVRTDKVAQYLYWMLETTQSGTLEITFDDTVADGFDVGAVLYGSDGVYVGGAKSESEFVGDSTLGFSHVSGSPFVYNIPDGFGHSFILLRVRRGNYSTGFDTNATFSEWAATALKVTLTVSTGNSANTANVLSVDDDIARNYSIATTSILGEEVAENPKSAYGLSSDFAAVIDEVKRSWMIEYGGDYRKIPIIVSTDQHGRTNAGIFNMLGETLNMYDVSKICNLGDTTEWVDADTDHPLLSESTLEAWCESVKRIPFSKQLNVFGNHDTWYSNYADEGNTIGTRYPSSQAHLYQYFRNIYARRTNNNGWFVSYDDQFNVKYVVVSGFEYRNNSVAFRIGTKQMTWLIEELSRNDGYDVVIVSHVPLLFDPEKAISPIGLEINEGYYRVSALDTDAFFSARKSRGSGTITDSDGVEHTYDFTNCENDVLCSLHGHTHEDAYLYLNDTLLGYTFDWFADNTFFMVLIDRVNRCLNVWKIEAPDGVPTYQNYQIPFDKPTA